MSPARLAAAALAAAAALLGCRVQPEVPPSPQSWRLYRNQQLGVAFDIPDYFTVVDYGSTVMFRFHGGNSVLLRWVDTEEAERRDLWVGTRPLGPITLGDRAGQRYTYEHHDGPIYSVTDSYVVPYRGKELGLEFRAEQDNPVKRHVLASFRFLADGAATTAQTR